jgi:hypothetical protein
VRICVSTAGFPDAEARVLLLAHTAPDAGRLPLADTLPVSGSTIDDHASSRFNCSSTCRIASTVGPATPYDPGTQAHAASRVCCKSSVARSTAIHSLNRSANSIATCTSCSLHKTGRILGAAFEPGHQHTKQRNCIIIRQHVLDQAPTAQALAGSPAQSDDPTIPSPQHICPKHKPVACSVTAEAAPVHHRLSSSDVWSLVSRKCL